MKVGKINDDEDYNDNSDNCDGEFGGQSQDEGQRRQQKKLLIVVCYARQFPGGVCV